jgi:hypothetical protein
MSGINAVRELQTFYLIYAVGNLSDFAINGIRDLQELRSSSHSSLLRQLVQSL